MLSWETQQKFTEEVNPGSEMLALSFYRVHPSVSMNWFIIFPF